jgi:hypothetical protein
MEARRGAGESLSAHGERATNVQGDRVEAKCSHCGHAFQIGGDVFGKEDRVDLPCPACKKPVSVANPKLVTLSIDRTRKKVPQVVSQISPEGRLLLIPADKELSLKVLEGEEKGTVYPVNKPRFLIGRTNGDVNLNDAQISRVHCALETSADGVLLKDLESTNGTYVDDQRIEAAPLASGARFRVGGHVLQLLIETREE